MPRFLETGSGAFFFMAIPNSLKRELKARAQLLEPVVKVGHAGVSDGFIEGLGRALDDHGLVKVRFTDFKEEKKRLAGEIAERVGAELVTRVGNVAVYYREKGTQGTEGTQRT
jgi:RNA-binding protein